MTAAPGVPLADAADLDERTLTRGRKLGHGGEGEVTELDAPLSGLVYKKYLRPGADGAALAALVDFPAALASAERDRLRQRAAWPAARVLSDGRVAGFVMRKIPEHFYGRAATGRSRPRELQYLLYEPRPLWGDIRPPDAAGRVAIAREIARLLAFLHAHALIVGDVSMTNFLWSPAGPEVFLIDCDGIRRLGRRPVQPTAQTENWDDPAQHAHAYPGLDSDRYKCALLIGRILSRSPSVRPDQPLDILPGVPEHAVRAVRALWGQAAAAGCRPGADRWAAALAPRELAPASYTSPDHAGEDLT